MTKSVIINPDKTCIITNLDGLDDLQAAVKGYIELIRLGRPRPGGEVGEFTMWCNEEYSYKFGATDFNSIATDLAGYCGRPDIMLGNPILGPVVLQGPGDDDGNDTDVPDYVMVWLKRIMREAGGTLVDSTVASS